MKKIIIGLILLALLAIPVSAKVVDFFILFKSYEAPSVPPAMDGVIANPATVKIANPAGQNISIN